LVAALGHYLGQRRCNKLIGVSPGIQDLRDHVQIAALGRYFG
jgi:hypothetical protein